ADGDSVRFTGDSTRDVNGYDATSDAAHDTLVNFTREASYNGNIGAPGSPVVIGISGTAKIDGEKGNTYLKSINAAGQLIAKADVGRTGSGKAFLAGTISIVKGGPGSQGDLAAAAVLAQGDYPMCKFSG